MEHSSHSTISADRPLTEPEQDALGHASFARTLARGLQFMASPRGTVVALYGKWGSGKSSVLNFVKRELAQESNPPVVLDFNPWWFSSAEDLAGRFFATLQNEFARNKVVGKRALEAVFKLGAIAGNLQGLPAGPVKDFLVDTVLGADLSAQKERVVKALAKQPRKVVIVIDDVDRLSHQEIRELFRVLKSIADFPNTTYLLAFDHDVVATSLDGTVGGTGASYLEKIVQAPFHLPYPDRSLLHGMFLQQLEGVLVDTPEETFDPEHWVNVFADCVAPFLETPRQVVRLLSCLSVSYPAVCGEVSAEDFVALEALRLFRPSVYDRVRQHPEWFAGITDPLSQYSDDRDALRKRLDSLLEEFADRGQLKTGLQRLFPELESVWGNVTYGQGYYEDWRRRGRASVPEMLQTHLRLSLPETTFSRRGLLEEVGRASSAEFVPWLRAQTSLKRGDGRTHARTFLETLRELQTEVPDNQVRDLVCALITVGDDLDVPCERGRGIFDFGLEMVLTQVVFKLLRRLEPSQRAALVLHGARNGFALGATLTIFDRATRDNALFGRTKNECSDAPLLAAAATEELAAVLLERIRATGIWALLALAKFPFIVGWWKQLGEPGEVERWAEDATADRDAFLRTLQNLTRETRANAIASRYVKVYRVIDPHDVALLLPIDVVVERVQSMLVDPATTPQEREVLETFMTGWRAREEGRDPRWEIDEDP